MTIGIPSAILAGIVCLTVAMAVLLRQPRRPLYARFAAFNLALFLWYAASVMSRLAGAPVARLQVFACLLIAPSAMLFFAELLRDHSPRSRRLTRVSYAVSAALLAADLSPWGSAPLLRVAAIAYVTGAIALVLANLLRKARRSRSETEKKRLYFLFYGGMAAGLLTSAELWPAAGAAAASGHVAATFYVYFLYQSILSRRLIDLVEFLGKAAVVGVLTIVLASVYAVLVLWVGAHEQGLWLFNTLVASFVILIVYDQVRPWVETTTAKLLFRERYELRQVVRRLVRALRTTISFEEMRDRVAEALASSGRVNQVAIYLLTEAELSFRLLGFRGERPPESLAMAQHPALLQELRREHRPMVLEQLIERREDLPVPLTGEDATAERELDRLDEAAASLRALHANVVIPILAEERILGVLTLGTEPAAESFSTDELALLLSVAEACAIVVENSQEFENRRERDRLVALGEMAAGLAHEIRNPLGAIKGAAQYLEPVDLPRDGREFIRVIVDEVDRLGRVVAQFLEYARPYRGNPIPTDLNAVVSATVRLLRQEPLPEQIIIEENLASALPLVSVDPEQLRQVLINLVRNAIQAMAKGGRVTISTESVRGLAREVWMEGPSNAARRSEVLLRVRDNGEGIPPENLSRIFVPFFTTKQGGTGLGLAISQRIVETAGGRIGVASRLGDGTTFTVRLPALVEAPSDSTGPVATMQA